MSACADALKDEGAANVWGLAFARQGMFEEDEDVKGRCGWNVDVILNDFQALTC